MRETTRMNRNNASKECDKMSLTSAHWGTYHAQVKDGRLTGLSHFAEDSDPSEIGKGIEFKTERDEEAKRALFPSNYAK